jgi:hypothetical protein
METAAPALVGRTPCLLMIGRILLMWVIAVVPEETAAAGVGFEPVEAEVEVVVHLVLENLPA